MKKKLTILLFGLLLAVGWTGSAFAQSQEEPFKAEDAKTWTYDWVDASGTTHSGVDPTEKVTDARQMYYLLRHVYMDKRFPGPYQSAYKADGTTRERDVYYGGMDSGWEIPGILISPSSTTTTTTSVATFNPQYSYSTVSTRTVDGVTLTTSSGDLGINANYMHLNGTNTISTSEGKITKIVFTGYNTTYPVSRLSTTTGNYTYSNNVGTWTGNASSVSFSASNSVICSRIEVTIEKTITTGGNTGIGDITIYGSSSSARIKSITVTSGNTTLFSWSMANDFINEVPGMSLGTWHYYGNTAIYALQDDPIILQGWLFEGYSSVTVTVNGYYYNNSSTFTVNGTSKTVTASSNNNSANHTWNINSSSFAGPPVYQADQYKPNKEGYTALIVKLNDNPYIKPGDAGFLHGQCFYESKDSIISYLERNVESIQLLTDGLVIGTGDQIGTVFNAPIDEYNKFFFLSKGQARQKSDMVVQEQVYREHLIGEQVPFAQLFEQFSPTGGKAGDQITDFYSEMMQGKVYRIVHDCLSVIQNKHQFSMSGNDGTTPYKMSGMNFFIPDHRLQYWELTDTVTAYRWNSSTESSEKYVKAVYTIDGRDMNSYQPASGTKTNDHSTFFTSPSDIAVWYAQYDTARHAPLVGLYLINLNAVANPCPDYSEDNRYYQSTLDWTSSLNEMSGNGVKQTYIIYQVVTDSITGEVRNVPIDTVENCTDFHPQLTLDTLYEQRAHSYTITYVIEGSPTDSDHPGFVAWSNTATVIIPGYDDFMVLDLHHYESDFVVNQEKNYYRNYMQPVNDFANGITAESIRNGFDSFILYRTSADGKVPVAKLKLAVNSNNQVLYKITYFDENEDYNNPNYNNTVLPSIINQLLNNQ